MNEQAYTEDQQYLIKFLYDKVAPSVIRVVELLVLEGASKELILERATTTAEAVVDAMNTMVNDRVFRKS